MQTNDDVYFLDDYNWTAGKVVSVTKNSIRIAPLGEAQERRVPPENVALPDENVCVVWEMWKGRNGRGRYRVERVLYPELRIPARDIGRQRGEGRVTEIAFVIDSYCGYTRDARRIHD